MNLREEKRHVKLCPESIQFVRFFLIWLGIGVFFVWGGHALAQADLLKDSERTKYQQRIDEAIDRDDPEFIRSYIEEGVSINEPQAFGETILHQAIKYGRTAVAAFMIQQGADVNATTTLGETPLHYVSFMEDLSQARKITKLLLQAGAEVDQRETVYGTTPLFWQEVPVAKLLIREGADVNFMAFNGKTPLFWHIESDAESMVQLLINKGADIHYTLEDGTSLIHVSCFVENLPIVKLLVENGIDINQVDRRGRTPLDIALREDNAPIVRYLLNHGAQKNMTTTELSFSTEVNP
jgi:ankyrin repeat protein